jgi:hypothetical protein
MGMLGRYVSATVESGAVWTILGGSNDDGLEAHSIFPSCNDFLKKAILRRAE